MKIYTFGGKKYEFEDDTPENDIADLFERIDQGATFDETITYAAGAAKRGLASAAVGGAKIIEDVFGVDLESDLARQGIAQEEAEQQPAFGEFNLFERGVAATAQMLTMAAPFAVAGPLGFASGVARGMAPRAAGMMAARGGATALAVPTGLTTYGESRAAGLSPWRSSGHAMFDALVEKYTEQVPLRVLAEAGGKGLWSTTKRFLGREMAGEQVATALQDINAKLSYNPDLTLKDYLEDVAITTMAVGMGGPIQTAATYPVSSALNLLTPEVSDAGTPMEVGQLSSLSTEQRVSEGMAELLNTPRIAETGAAVPPTIDVVDITQISREARPVPEGFIRLYNVQAPGAQAQQEGVWSRSLRDVQDALNAAEGQLEVTYVNVSPRELEAKHRGASEEAKALISDPETQYILPRGYLTGGNRLYAPAGERKETPVTTGQPVQKPTPEQPKQETPSVVPGQAPTPEPARPRFPLKSRVQRGATGEVGLTFTDEPSAALFRAGQLIRRRKVAEGERILRELSSQVAVPVSMLREQAVMFQKQVQDRVKLEPAGEEVLVETPEVLRERQLPMQELDEVSSQAVEGTVVIRKGVGVTTRIEKSQALLQRWVNALAPKMKVVITGTAPVGFIGVATPQENGTISIQIASEDQPDAKAMLNLAHEFGHALTLHYVYHPENSRLLSDLRAEHESLRAGVDDMTVREFLDVWSGPRSRAEEVRRFGLTMDSPAWQYIRARDAQWQGNIVELNGPEALDRFRAVYGDSYTLSFDEYAAEQVARYLKRQKMVPAASQSWAKAFAQSLRDFISKILGRFANQPKVNEWLENLRQGNPMGLQANTSSLPPIPREFYELDTDARMELTTKVLTRLPQKAKWKKVTIQSEIYRQDVKEQERQLFLDVLKSFPGNEVEAHEFQRAVLAEIVPLNLVKQNPPYGGYVYQNVGINPGLGIAHIYEVPFAVQPDPHFGNDHYFGHTQVAIEQGVVDGEPFVQAYSVLEVQSNLLQRTQEVDSPGARAAIQSDIDLHESRFRKYQEAAAEVAEANTDAQIREVISGFATSIQAQANLLLERASISVEERARRMSRFFEGLAQQSQALVSDNRARLQKATDRTKLARLPKNWWELLIREEYRNAQDMGAKKFRMVTAETAARAEGWARVFDIKNDVFVPQLEGVSVATESGEMIQLTGQITNVNTDPNNFEAAVEFVNPNDPSGTNITLMESVQDSVFDDIMVKAGFKFGFGRNEGIYRRYRNEITRFMKREFGAKEVSIPSQRRVERIDPLDPMDMPDIVDERVNNTWLEADVVPDTKGLPLEYYELDEANEDATNTLADAVANKEYPDAPAALRNFPRVMFSVLQLNQIAKLLPDVPGLQDYREAMRRMWNMKNQLMAGPNDRIKEWYRLSVEQSHKAEQFLRDEVNEKRHYTELVQDTLDSPTGPIAVWKHMPTEDFMIEMKSRGINEEAASLIVDIKNDFLITLDAMEKTVLRSINNHFRNNPFGARTRKLEAQREFQKLRDVPYLPDRRWGKWGVTVKATEDFTEDGVEYKAGETLYRAQHESRFARNKELVQLEKEYGKRFSVKPFYMEDSIFVMRGLPRDFVRAVKSQLQLTAEDIEKLEQIQYDYTKEGAYFKLLGKGKKQIGGASTDIRRVYADYHWRTANLISKMAETPHLNAALDKIRTEAAEAGDPSSMLEVLHERLNRTMNYVLRPSHEFEQMRAWVSLWYLWGVPKTAAMNFMSVPVFTTAYVTERYGIVNGAVHVTKAIKDATRYMATGKGLSKDESAMLSQATDDGVVDQSFAAELAAVSDANAMERLMPRMGFFKNQNLRDSTQKAIWKTVDAGMLPFRGIEKLNRMTTLLAVYRAEVQKGAAPITSGDKTAYMAARNATDYTQNDYNPWNRPAFMQGKQSLFLIFYSFVQHVGFFMFGGDKGWWRAWLIMFALAGIQGLPLVDDIIDVLNAVWKKVSGEHIDLRLEARELAKNIGLAPDLVMHGATHNLFGLGWDVSYSVGFGRMVPGLESAFSEGDFDSNFVRFIADAGGPFTSIGVGALKAIHDDNPNSLARWERVMPTALRNVSKAVRMEAEGAMTDGRGRVLVEGPEVLETVGQVLGATPSRKARRQEMLATARDVQTFYDIRRRNLMAQWHQAKMSRDVLAVRDVEQRIRAFNEDLPYRQLRIDRRSLITSSRARRRSEDALREANTTERRYRHLYRDLREVYDVEP